ncbi:polyamine aminopropyltransferase [Sulfuriroseicoccus oceanibius]|uniref:Polyamine aminopropyltransferase n=1 Tax=Sulfuriroseicoccus oceanibius TaxID=2707525 RepID=A0A6B3L9L7_9BACT|nr:polyamine aminopropyltransferase [Sulfuriroseicoccus oceanibius]QQL45671.1 polyamine aminopropyltransferase [Sulfuriroseicoccus oceanibius]
MTDAVLETPKDASRWRLGLLMFLLGGCGLAYEYTLSKIAADLLGNSVQQWATIIATMLFAMGVGAEWQKRIDQDQVSSRLVDSQMILALVGGFGPLLMVYSFSLLADYYILVQYGLALVVGTLIGFEIPLIMRLNEDEDPEMRVNLARVLKMDYIGALVGALVWTFLFVRYMSISQVSFALGLVTVGSTCLILWMYWKRVAKGGARLVQLAVVTALLITGFVFSKPWMVHAEQFLYRDRIVFSATTPYQHVVLTENAAGKIGCYINGHLQFREEDEFIYHENLVHPAMMLAPQRKRVLILGGGDGLAAREVLKYPEVEELLLVDIDPQMTDLAVDQPDLARMNGGVLKDARVVRVEAGGIEMGGEMDVKMVSRRDPGFRGEGHKVASVRVVNVDAASFLREAPGVYDVVIMDFPDPSSPDLAKLYSRPFYENLKSCLHEGSVIVQQSGSPYHAKEAFLCIGRTLAHSGYSVMPYHDNVPSFGEWGWWIGVAGTGNEETLKSAFAGLSRREIPVDVAYLTPELIGASAAFGKGQLESENSDITSLTEGRVYDYYSRAWK